MSKMSVLHDEITEQRRLEADRMGELESRLRDEMQRRQRRDEQPQRRLPVTNPEHAMRNYGGSSATEIILRREEEYLELNRRMQMQELAMEQQYGVFDPAPLRIPRNYVSSSSNSFSYEFIQFGPGQIVPSGPPAQVTYAIPVVETLPSHGTINDLVILAANKKVYIYDGQMWFPAIKEASEPEKEKGRKIILEDE